LGGNFLSANFNIAILASGKGSNFKAIVDAIRSGSIQNAAVVLCISNNSEAGALVYARQFEIPALHISRKQFTSDTDFNSALIDALVSHHTTLVVLAGYMKKLDPSIIRAFQNRIINIHPALLPAFGGPGMYGHHVHEAVVASGMRESGATVHVVDEEYDHGRILLQEKVTVGPFDNADSLAEKVLRVEHELYPRAIRMICNGEINLDAPPVQ
jgi:phosphoribosylglycinamide formyltransferase-1